MNFSAYGREAKVLQRKRQWLAGAGLTADRVSSQALRADSRTAAISRIFDVAVVGAGPAGSAAAHALSRGGARVCVIERARLPRYKTCGGGLVRRAVRQIPFELGSAVELECRQADLRFLRSGLHYRITEDVPLIHMTMRAALDHRLLLQAVDEGAEVLSPCTVEGLQQEPETVKVRTDRGSVAARFVLGCDGAGSTVARHFGPAERIPMLPACECEVYVGANTLDRFRDSARFDFELLSAGYAWVFPKRDHLSVGILRVRAGPLGCRRLIQGYLDRLRVGDIQRIERHGHVLPGRARAQVARGRVLLAGDAAGLVDPVLWEGISYARQSGRLAGEALLRSGLHPEASAHAYCRAVEREILSELRIARWLGQLLYDYPRASGWLFRRRGTSLCEAMARIIAGEATYRSMVCSARNYIRLLWGSASRGR
jgi:geranylgeranyl reductase family protein